MCERDKRPYATIRRKRQTAVYRMSSTNKADNEWEKVISITAQCRVLLHSELRWVKFSLKALVATVKYGDPELAK